MWQLEFITILISLGLLQNSSSGSMQSETALRQRNKRLAVLVMVLLKHVSR